MLPRTLQRFCILGSFALGFASGCDGSIPEFGSLEDQEIAVGEELRLVVVATDVDGDRLRYRYRTDIQDVDSRVTFGQLPEGAAEFRWTPRASDLGIWFIDFFASDAVSTAETTVRVLVRAATGDDAAPRFVRPTGRGTGFDARRERQVELQVEVLDLDSARVHIRQKPALEGATLEEVADSGGKRAVFRYRPSLDELRRGARHVLHFWADDGEYPPVHKSYILVFHGGEDV